MFYARILFACSYTFIPIGLVMKEVIVQQIFTNPMKSVSPTTMFTLTNSPRPVEILRRSFRNLQRPLLVNLDCCCLSIQCFTSECYLQFLPTNKIRKSHHHIHQPNGAHASAGGCEEVLLSSTAEVIESLTTFLVGHDYYCLLMQCFMPEISQEYIPTTKCTTTTTTTTTTSVSSSMPVN